jgi:hypothetical protein
MIPNAFPVSLGRMPAPSAGRALYHKNAGGINGVLLAEMQFVNSF